MEQLALGKRWGTGIQCGNPAGKAGAPPARGLSHGTTLSSQCQARVWIARQVCGDKAGPRSSSRCESAGQDQAQDQCLRGRYQEDRTRLFTLVHGGCLRDNKCKLKQEVQTRCNENLFCYEDSQVLEQVAQRELCNVCSYRFSRPKWIKSCGDLIADPVWGPEEVPLLRTAPTWILWS